jgi:GNAT superfamily N-acetyltransferase
MSILRRLAVQTSARTSLVEFDERRIDELVPMWRASFEAGVGVIDPHPIEEQRQYFLAEVLPRHKVRMALRDTELVGFVAASEESVSQLFVRVGHQRQGIGAELLAWAKSQSNGSLWLYTFARNLGARVFYERNGFVAVARGFEPTWQLEDIRYRWVAPAQNAA